MNSALWLNLGSLVELCVLARILACESLVELCGEFGDLCVLGWSVFDTVSVGLWGGSVFGDLCVLGLSAVSVKELGLWSESLVISVCLACQSLTQRAGLALVEPCSSL